jgi:hypothetical protein
MDIEPGLDGKQGNAQEIIERAETCPACNHTAAGAGFEACPKCGLIIRKYYSRQHQPADIVPGLTACKTCGEMSAGAPSCPKCGEPNPLEARARGTHAKITVSILFLIAAVIFAVFEFRQLNPNFALSSSSFKASQKNVPNQETSTASLSPTDAPSAKGSTSNAAAASVEQESASPSAPPVPIPYAMNNSLGITRARTVFTSALDGNNMPVNDLSRISISEKKIVAHIKVRIPPEKSYQVTGKLFDPDGHLILNITGPAIPKGPVWCWWFYHDFDRSFDKPGMWKFAFFVNGEEIAEKQVEVFDQ